ncbi:MAG: metallophosphoesterase [Thermoplasmata archaeon]|nr:metallophosphoesterase [Thermoplasmata archaeon]
MGRSFVFAHLADAHVGAWPRDPAFRSALRDSVLRALEVVSERDCAFLLISGDLFHTPIPDPTEVAPIAAALRRLVAEGRRVYTIYGSHDYVAHRTSWLDVLAESGLFLRAAPEPVHSQDDRWSLRFLVDAPTGAVIAGLSGRSRGLDAAYFRSIDSESFRAAPGFHIFQFHAAVKEYLPAPLRDHVDGISVEDLPGGCQYYAGGHIHATYEGTGPGGGRLVNPGAVFGTSLTDLENATHDITLQGLAIVTVREDEPTVELVATGPGRRIQMFDIDVDGKRPEEAQSIVAQSLEEHGTPGGLLIPRLRGTLIEGSSRALGLHAVAESAGANGLGSVHFDLKQLTLPGSTPQADAFRPESEIEEEVVRQLAARAPPALSHQVGPEALGPLADLLRDLGVAQSEGQSKTDYQEERIHTALQLLGVRTPTRIREE